MNKMPVVKPKFCPVISARLLWVVFLLCVILFYFLTPILAPFCIAAVLAYLGDPLVDRLQNKRINRTIGVSLVFLIFLIILTVLLLILIPLLQKQFHALYTKMPLWIEWLQNSALPWLQQHFGVTLHWDSAHLQSLLSEHWQAASHVLLNTVGSISSSGLLIVDTFSTVLLIPVVAFYLMRDWKHIVSGIVALLPNNNRTSLVQLGSECNQVLSAFFRGQLYVMLGLAICYSLGLAIVGLDMALLIGLLAGGLAIVPYLGLVVGASCAICAALFQFHSLQAVIEVAIVFGVGQLLESFLLTPYLVGDKIGLHPVTVIFALLAGGQLFGFVGVLVALPCAAVISVLLRHAHRQYLQSNWFQ